MANDIRSWARVNCKNVQLHRTNFWEDIAGIYRYKVPFDFADVRKEGGRHSQGEGALDFVTADYAAYHAAMATSDNRYDDDNLLPEAEAYLAGQPMTTEPYAFDLDAAIEAIDFDA